MIKVNLKDSLVENKIIVYENKVAKLAEKIKQGVAPHEDFLGWKDWPENYNQNEVKRIKKIVANLKHLQVKVLVVIGIGGSYIGAKAGIEMIKGLYPLNDDSEVMFLGETLSSSVLAQKLAYLENKDFAINVISKSGTTLEPALAFKLLKKILEDKVGKNNAKNYIIATTDANQGLLLDLAKTNEYETFVIPDNIGGRFSVLTPVGLFPLAWSGINIDKVLKGAQKGNQKYSTTILKDNPAYQYAVARVILSQKYPVELMVQFEPQMQAFSEWWKQLAGESEGKNDKGLFPASAIFSTDLHSLGQFIQSGSKVLFETMMFVKNPLLNLQIISDQDNLDKLNYLANLTVHQINHAVFEATKDAHNKVAKVPLIELILEDFSETTFGELVIFFQRAVAMTAYLLGVNPYDQPGVEVYKQNTFKVLKHLTK